MQVKLDRKRRILSQGHQHYSKISHKSKILLLKKVLCDGLEIKESAQSLNINYSTAKTLMRKFKTQGEEIDTQVLRGISNWFENYEVQRNRCQYKVIQRTNCCKGRLRGGKKRIQIDTYEVESKNTIPCTYQQSNLSATPIQILQQVLFRSDRCD